jgi:hypothetical protein
MLQTPVALIIFNRSTAMCPGAAAKGKASVAAAARLLSGWPLSSGILRGARPSPKVGRLRER